ncbi:MAG: DUF1572 family protein [Longimicrobiales bacterium]
MSPLDDVAALFVGDARDRFAWVRDLADRAIAQLSDEEFMGEASERPERVVAIQVKHLAGLHVSRWTDFIVADGEKPDRDRDAEFTLQGETRDELMERWDLGWTRIQESLDGLTQADLTKTLTIRGEPHSVPKAIHRSLAHAAYHVGQIVMLARNLKGDDWQTLSIPPGGTAEHNRQMAERFGGAGPGSRA